MLTSELLNSNLQQSFARKLIRPFVGIKKETIENEIRAIKKLCKTDHPNIVQVLEYGQLNNNTAFYFIDMELCDATLENYLCGKHIEGLISWETIRQRRDVHKHAYKILQHIVNGLLYIHCLREVQRDLSPHNGALTY